MRCWESRSQVVRNPSTLTSLYPQSDSCRVLLVVLRKLFYKFTWTSVLNNDLENRLAKYNIVLANRVEYISRPFNLQLLFVWIFYYMLSHWHWNDVIVAGVSLLFVCFLFVCFVFLFLLFFAFLFLDRFTISFCRCGY